MMTENETVDSKNQLNAVGIPEKTHSETIEVQVVPPARPTFARAKDNQSGKHGLRSFDQWYGADYDYDSLEVQADLKREAVSILSQAMAGRKVPSHVYRAAETVVTRGVFPEKRAPDSVHFHVSQYAVEQAKKRAGLPSGDD